MSPTIPRINLDAPAWNIPPDDSVVELVGAGWRLVGQARGGRWDRLVTVEVGERLDVERRVVARGSVTVDDEGTSRRDAEVERYPRVPARAAIDPDAYAEALAAWADFALTFDVVAAVRRWRDGLGELRLDGRVPSDVASVAALYSLVDDLRRQAGRERSLDMRHVVAAACGVSDSTAKARIRAAREAGLITTTKFRKG